MTITTINLALMALTGLSGILLAHWAKYPHMMQRRVDGLKWLINNSPWPYVLASSFIVVSFISWLWYLIDGGMF